MLYYKKVDVSKRTGVNKMIASKTFAGVGNL